MLRELVKILSYMDWLRPLVTIAQNKTNGPSHTFLIPDDCGWSPKQVESHLREKGIKTWGLDVYRDSIMLSATAKQAALVQHLLEKQGIAVENPVEARLSERNQEYNRRQPQHHGRSHGHRSTTSARHNPLDSLNDKLDSWSNQIFGD